MKADRGSLLYVMVKWFCLVSLCIINKYLFMDLMIVGNKPKKSKVPSSIGITFNGLHVGLIINRVRMYCLTKGEYNFFSECYI